jgi:hypothetical protein
MKELIKALRRQAKLQKICKHKNKSTIRNNGDYKLRVQCKDCGKLIKYKFNQTKDIK